MDYKRSARQEGNPSVESRISYREDNPINNKSYREGNPKNFRIPSKLVIESATQDILLTLKWLNKFLENLLFARSLYLNFVYLKSMT
jgi:hypothetical protein